MSDYLCVYIVMSDYLCVYILTNAYFLINYGYIFLLYA